MIVPPLTEKADTTRYFIVCVAYASSGQFGHGSTVVTTDGSYINREDTITNIADEWELATDDIAITHIIELSKSDYEDFIKQNPI